MPATTVLLGADSAHAVCSVLQPLATRCSARERRALAALAAAASIAAASRGRRTCCSPQNEAATVPTSEIRALAAGVGHLGHARGGAVPSPASSTVFRYRSTPHGSRWPGGRFRGLFTGSTAPATRTQQLTIAGVTVASAGS